MKLQLLIPYYNCKEALIKRLLDSIENQLEIDFSTFSVFIINDGGESQLTTEFLNKYSYNITYKVEEHRGISGTRNSLLKQATGDYIMFCDQDDYFTCNKAFMLIYKYIEDNECEVLTSALFEEDILNKINIVSDINTTGINGTLLHGRVYKRDFILDNNICFNTLLDGVEDFYFAALSLSMSNKVRHCNIPYYIWSYNPDSVTKQRIKDWNNELYSYLQVIESSNLIVKYLLEHNHELEASIYVMQLLYDSYFRFSNVPFFNSINYKDMIDKVKIRIKQYYIDYSQYLKNINDELLLKIIGNKTYFQNIKVGFNKYLLELGGNK